MSGYNILTVNEIGCKWSLKKNTVALSERKPSAIHFRERAQRSVVIEVDGNSFIRIDDSSFIATTTAEASDASLFRVHSDPFDIAAEGLSFELLNFRTLRWLRHCSFLLRADEKGTGASFALDATFIVQPVKAKTQSPKSKAAAIVRTPGSPVRPMPSPVSSETPRKGEENVRPKPSSTGTPARPLSRKRPAEPDEFSEFKQKLAKLQNSLDNWL